ncbi:MAG: hypothetical protein EOR30_29355 [Mesorhizobium sp.]|uniref:hypothetical protein n=1 Tax=unclassified Mesorhizobium TaxID=325217 RepID=UPI000FCC50BA|nr:MULTISPECIES: hypothetical protein [unclassified Mesorhizobium]RUV74838.1 hypothetical protein EOA78_07930 [Mesorhizobium sp. M5C.F.Cr.IN.023.01.1.1]RWF88656.1 MAG: hypothetical protein EOQ36_07440 [Mesorhizobium sp.]RWF92953.1 MAG: hypothetical protein EOQ45_19290 [Mesorhizobium sp.]RWI41277.1 MAG: hypothetical protein EOR14_09425 [Mesorhizobium sp.]RWI49731.1 MAG: hypothetical protein EOR15_11960 [Mesorhizobium sp.]
MGLDYIRAQTGKPWKKRWNGGLDRLKQPTLLDLTMSEAAQTVTVELQPGTSLRAGDTLIVERGPTGVTVSDGLRPIGRVSRPSADLASALATGGGYAEGTAQRIGLFGDTAEVSIR